MQQSAKVTYTLIITKNVSFNYSFKMWGDFKIVSLLKICLYIFHINTTPNLPIIIIQLLLLDWKGSSLIYKGNTILCFLLHQNLNHQDLHKSVKLKSMVSNIPSNISTKSNIPLPTSGPFRVIYVTDSPCETMYL